VSSPALKGEKKMCNHQTIQGDNYGETCMVCGEVLSGFGFWAEGGNSECVHQWLPYDDKHEICPYCEEIRLKEEINV
jgi:hypothetical protein